ncbi:hypothetical protein CH92_15720 [Stutzerimonas stutzeri]|uniref:Uncharacterized protein n=1 Tax=Stutzerimonas stutzeri TaxID=316 RepID=W8RDB9_STUST|nr:hypothetical protein [Stutzerimonas stutzeri]AHL76462.1 hypothetical protein CH92_15720 [Stutzerimonas stutzeri]MCQ4329697.1 hypothetical protein [Stutzerimonas stutzeri]
MPANNHPPRDSILANPDALSCTIYRAHETDPDGEEQDMGDARVIITGQFEPPQEWDAKARADYFDGMPEDAFLTAVFASEADADSKGFFNVEADDYAAVTERDGTVSMFYVCERLDDGTYVLLREEDDGEE